MRYQDYESWAADTGAFPHTGSSLTAQVTASGLQQDMSGMTDSPHDDWTWGPSGVYVKVFTPVVTIGGGGATSENGGPITFTVSRDGDASVWTEDLVVALTISGDADDDDFVGGIPRTVTIKAGQGSSEPIVLTPRDDADTEADKGQPGDVETLVVAVADGANYEAAAGPPPAATIADDASYWADREWIKYDALETAGTTEVLGEKVVSEEWKPSPDGQSQYKETTKKRYVASYSWRWLAQDASDNWGLEPYSEAHLKFNVTYGRDISVGAELGLEHLGLTVTASAEATITTSTTAEKEYKVDAELDRQFLIKACIRHVTIREYTIVEKDYGVRKEITITEPPNSTPVLQGDIRGDFDHEFFRKKRYWLDEESVGNQDLVKI